MNFWILIGLRNELRGDLTALDLVFEICDNHSGFWGGKKLKIPTTSKIDFPKLVRLPCMIYHSTRLGERFSNLFSDPKNLYAFESYGQNTISIVDRQNLGYWL